MIINHNISALNTHRQLSSATNAQSKSMEKLASGMRINRAGDDAAGLAISEKMRGQIRGLDQASRNSQDAISLIQTAEGALNETTDILQRMRELATQAATDTNTTNDRGEIQKEMDSLTSEINRIGNTTEFNTQKLLNGSKDTATAGTGLQFQIGANENQSLTLEIGDMRAAALGLTGTAGDTGFTAANGVSDGTNSTPGEAGLDVSTAANASAAITAIQGAIDTVSAERSKLGANQNRLEHTINNLGTSSENLTAAESRVRDTDMAKTMMEQTKNSILAQASQAMLAQANQQPQGVLQLLR
ncbi:MULTISPECIES: flagellin Hag [Peribacillus]|uniref:Flagellin n=1 Tax=Peribacillus castrilensis TaxID=2897690 RepID=A0AAW9N8S1_9BACI|nr:MULTISPECIES: flagellin Hag [Peribacillus]MEC0271752.1 flagellin Hag [Peribacillus castrilensis]MBX9954268.1 flagellin Hag [Peribacillus simplex]MCY8937806.1 flagellin Hag [Peribacillus frigoritolerans]MEC0346856.1 flagellin Hag [Peribacillus castrilensis]TFH61757.1 flagellin [Peribacillus frigoritolerans]